jgi:hypothetical protein
MVLEQIVRQSLDVTEGFQENCEIVDLTNGSITTFDIYLAYSSLSAPASQFVRQRRRVGEIIFRWRSLQASSEVAEGFQWTCR